MLEGRKRCSLFASHVAVKRPVTGNKSLHVLFQDFAVRFGASLDTTHTTPLREDLFTHRPTLMIRKMASQYFVSYSPEDHT